MDDELLDSAHGDLIDSMERGGEATGHPDASMQAGPRRVMLRVTVLLSGLQKRVPVILWLWGWQVPGPGLARHP
jgi:hypothetical protein